jgi:hypothetical protein
VGSIIIGPCPQCKELVAVFCGQVLALDKAIMESGSLDERRDHVVGVLTEFLHDRVHKLMEDQELLEAHALDEGDGAEMEAEEHAMGDAAISPSEPSAAAEEISQNELDRFVQVDLKLLDNNAYFKSVFDG